MSTAAAAVTWDQVRAWRVRRHHLDHRVASTPTALAEVTARICGLHAQVMSSAEMSACNRIENITPADVERALWQDHTLVKLWAVRGTLHLLPSSEYPMWQAALSTYRHFLKPAWLKASGLSPTELDQLNLLIGEALDGGPLTREELADRVAELSGSTDLGDRLRGSWGSMLKPASFRGVICFGPSDGQRVRFARPDRWLVGKRNKRLTTPWAGTPEEALTAVAARFLGAYGPADRDDFARWSAHTPAAAKKLFVGLGDAATIVDVEGSERWILTEHLPALTTAEPTRSVRLLPAFDPYVIGATRHARELMSPTAPARDIVDRSGRPARIYRDQGWLSPVLLVDGRMDGVWRHERKGRQLVVEIEPFEKLPARVTRDATAEAERLAGQFGATLSLSWTG